MKQQRLNISWYVLADTCGAAFTWLCFYFLRTVIYKYPFSIPPGFYIGGFLYIIGWLSLHFLSGAYENVYGKSGIYEILRTFIVSLIGCLALLFFFILKNPHTDNNNYYEEFYSLIVPVFFVTLFSRLLFLAISNHQLKNNKVSFNILVIGSAKYASRFYQSFNATRSTNGYVINSFLNINGNTGISLPENIRKYNDLAAIDSILQENDIEEVVITVDKNERDLLKNILRQLSDKDVNIKITPDAVDIITGAVQTKNVLGIPLIDVHSGLLPSWQKNVKRMIDIFTSLLAAILLSPLLVYAALRTKFSSAGTVFFCAGKSWL